MAGRKIRDAADARRCLAAAAVLGVTAGEWASGHGVDGRSLHTWSLNLSGRAGRRYKPEKALRLVELVAEQASARSRFTLRVGGVAVEVDGNFDEVALRRLLAVVSSC